MFLSYHLPPPPPPPPHTHTHCRIESKHEVTILGGLNEFIVKFFGPSGSKHSLFSMYIYMYSIGLSDYWL